MKTSIATEIETIVGLVKVAIQSAVTYKDQVIVTPVVLDKALDIYVEVNPNDTGSLLKLMEGLRAFLKKRASDLGFANSSLEIKQKGDSQTKSPVVSAIRQMTLPIKEKTPGVIPTIPDSDKYALFSWEVEILPQGSLATFLDPFQEVKLAVAKTFGVRMDCFKSDSRGVNKISHARMAAMYICAKWQLGTLEEIATQFNRLEHGSVYNALKRTSERVSEPGNMKTLIKRTLCGASMFLLKVCADNTKHASHTCWRARVV